LVAAPLRIGIVAILGAWGCVAVAADAAADPQRPNVVVLIADDLGYAELGCQGNRDIPTPHIDSLAAAGVRFTSGYVTAPFCAASRAGLLTGRYQTRFGFEFNPIGERNADPAIGLPRDVPTLAARLHAAGYATGLVGKWHLGGTAAYHPQRRGFDEFFGFLHEGHTYVLPTDRSVATWLRRKALPDGGQGRWTSGDGRLILSTHLGSNEPPYDADNPFLRGSQPVAEPDYLTDAFTREAAEFIVQHRERPFFLCVAYNAVHSPMQATLEDLERFAHLPDVQRRIFAAMLHRLDAGVGTILGTLSAEQLERRTIVWFISDNGGPTRELTSSNAPLRGGKGELYEGGVRVPFLVRWPGVVAPGRVEATPVSSLDIAATSLAAAGVPVDAGELDGIDLRPLLALGGTADAPRSLFWRVGEWAALRQGDFKLVRQSGREGPGDWQLYNLADDAAETHNLAADEPERRDRLLQEWERLNAQMQPPSWGRR
jgi:arylsulfatase B